MTHDNPQETQSNTHGVDKTLARHGGLSYLEIPALDPRQSAVFYANVLGWNVHSEDPDHPKFSDQSGHLIGRWIADRTISRQPGMLPYIYVNYIDDIVKKVAPNGGQIIKSPYREGNLWVSLIRDPAGNTIGLWQEQDARHTP